MSAIPSSVIQELLAHCVQEKGFTSPLTLEFTDAEGRVLAARFYEDRGPMLTEGNCGWEVLQPPFDVFAYDEEGATAAFTLPVFEISPPPRG